MKPQIFRVRVSQGLLWLMVAAPALGQQEQHNLPGGLLGFAKQGGWNTTMVNNVDWAGYEYEPSVVSNGVAYYCGFDGQSDVIESTTITSHTASPFKIVVPRSSTGSYNDYGFACGPSFVEVSTPALPGLPFALYYECAGEPLVGSPPTRMPPGWFPPLPPQPPPNQIPNQICVAFSPDGVTFSKYADSTGNPIPVIPAGTLNQYGSGHPSAVIGPTNNLLYLYYFAQNDLQPSGSSCQPAVQPTNPGCVGTWLQLMYQDGVTPYGGPIYTGVQATPMQIKYYSGPGAPTGGMFIGVANYNGRAYFNYSLDGIHWDWTDPTTLPVDGGIHYMGWSGALSSSDQQYRTDQCVASGTPTLASDLLGHISSTTGNVQLFEGEGGFSDYHAIVPPTMYKYPSELDSTTHKGCHDTREEPPPSKGSEYRGYTWNLYEVDGAFTQGTFVQTDKLNLTNTTIPGTASFQTTQTITEGGGLTVQDGASSANVTLQGSAVFLEPEFRATAGAAPVTFHAIASQ